MQKITTNLEGIDLPESFVLGWKAVNAQVVFQMEFALLPTSLFYQQPREGERTCFRRGILVFDRVSSVEGLKREEDVPGTTDASGERDYGNIDTFEEEEGEVRFSGEFGEVTVRCAACHLEFHNTKA